MQGSANPPTETLMKLFLSHLDSPLGQLRLLTDAQTRVHALDFTEGVSPARRRLGSALPHGRTDEGPAPASVADALARYFTGDWQALDAVPVHTQGTALQEQVWQALRRVPAGRTLSYGELARSLGLDDPRAAIDVGAANAANPIALIVPCHRVVAADGALRGYAWGLERKRWLLTHEHALTESVLMPQTASLF